METRAEIQTDFTGVAVAPEEYFPKRVFCDVHQTLENPGGNELVLYHIPLLHFLKIMKNIGYEVIIFSGSPHRTECLKDMCRLVFNDPDIFGHVQNKKIYAGTGTKAEYVIDDRHDTHDIMARHKWGPMDNRLFDLYDRLVRENPQFQPKTFQYL